jgi:monoamine oxidase
MTRSPLLSHLFRALWKAEKGSDGVSPSRRAFLKTVAAAPIVYAPAIRGSNAPRVAIVGGGIAGLSAAWALKKAGHLATIYESSARSGGRMYTAKGVAAPEVTTELGGEFVDMGHREILRIAKQFSLPLIDTWASTEKGLHAEAFLLGGQQRHLRELVEEFRGISPRLQADVKASARAGWERFDKISIAEYLDSTGLRSGWLRAALDVAYRTEYGMDVEEQSAMNMLSLLNPKLVKNRIRFFGESDERYKIAGGNQRVADAVAGEVRDRIQFGMRLEALAESAAGYVLSFAKDGGGAEEVRADVVVLAIPFTILRRVAMRVEVPAEKKKAIQELGYGTNAKIFFGFERRLWREKGYAGALFTDTDCQLVWDSSRQQATSHGALTMLTGGKAGVNIGEGAPEEHEQRLLPEVEKIWPGLRALRTGKAGRFHWPSHVHTLGAYSCYRVGQWQTLRGKESTPLGKIFFAGEHCSEDAQGYMEGGAATGKAAGEKIAKM